MQMGADQGAHYIGGIAVLDIHSAEGTLRAAGSHQSYMIGLHTHHREEAGLFHQGVLAMALGMKTYGCPAEKTQPDVTRA